VRERKQERAREREREEMIERERERGGGKRESERKEARERNGEGDCEKAGCELVLSQIFMCHCNSLEISQSMLCLDTLTLFHQDFRKPHCALLIALNTAACLVLKAWRRCHVSPLLRYFSWIPID